MELERLCHSLMTSDSEAEVVKLLRVTGYWESTTAWRYLGDTENNFGVIGNQQSEAVAALIEKLVNGVDARLLNSCLERGIDPMSASAPPGIRHAVARFFEDHGERLPQDAGLISLWPDAKATREADQITLAATGYSPREGSGLPSLSIADGGEGQTPDMFPQTFLSLQRSNKLRVQFVQGKFNMGATGALQFCSPKHRLQLLVSRRNPLLLRSPQPRDLEWGFTVVRRELPSKGSRSSVFTYLAPIETNIGRDGKVLSFSATEWPIFPLVHKNERNAYGRGSSHGSLVKLYEYNLDGTKSNVVRSGGGLLSRVDLGMPELALPIRIYECRKSYRGHSGSFATNVLGVVARLDRDRSEKLEDGFPVGQVVLVDGMEVRIRAYALKESARDYRSGNSAIVFTINGQTHAKKSVDFFRRRAVGMSQLADSLIVIVDCTKIDGQLREDLFMNSRDRLREVRESARLERELERFLHDDPTLRQLKNRRRESEIAQKLNEARPLAEALTELVRETPGLSRLLRGGRDVPSPFPKEGAKVGSGSAIFAGKRFPTFFRFRHRADGVVLDRVAHLESTTRLRFETDAEDAYFHRDRDRGEFEVDVLFPSASEWTKLADLSLTGPALGVVNMTFDLPQRLLVGDRVKLKIAVTDQSRVEPFVLEACLRIEAPVKSRSGTSGKDKVKNDGSGVGGRDSDVALPNIIPVRKSEWDTHGFDEMSALKVVGQGTDPQGLDVYDFYVNYDNKHLLAAQKDPARDAKALAAQFVYSLVLLSLALLIEEKQRSTANEALLVGDGDIERVVGAVARKLAPFVLPTLEAMSALTE